ncbi:MAG: nucleotidyltransferase domain-containing protein [bacterium]|nr:nucleotidyltransferase domain-containing protein [bacterium]
MNKKAFFKEQIENIKSQLIDKYKPEKIILFGSAARGEFNKDSDLDFLIIKKDTPYLGRDRARNLRKLIKKEVAVDFLIYRPEEFNARMKLGDPFLKAILKEGIALYGE